MVSNWEPTQKIPAKEGRGLPHPYSTLIPFLVVPRGPTSSGRVRLSFRVTTEVVVRTQTVLGVSFTQFSLQTKR